MREFGTMVRPETATIGIPVPADVHDVVAFGSTITVKSEPAYRSPVTSSRTRAVIGKSGRAKLRSTHVAAPAPLHVTSNTCPVVVGVFTLYPLYAIQAW